MKEQINEISLSKYIDAVNEINSLNTEKIEIGSDVIDEIQKFSFMNLGDIDKEIGEQSIKAHKTYLYSIYQSNSAGLLRGNCSPGLVA